MHKVSVIIPCYNDGQYITKSITSVLKQTYPYIEIIVVDDGSTDEATKRILRGLVDEKIKVIYASNQGPAAARNKGIALSTGEYILPLDADDIIAPTYIEKAVKAIEEDPTRGIIYCEAEFFGRQRGKWNLPPYSLKRMLVDNVIFVTALFRKEDWVLVGGFDVEIKGGMEDYDFWLSLIERGRAVYQLPETLFYYRKKKDSRTVAFHQELETVAETYAYIYKKHKELYEKHHLLYERTMREEWIKQVLFKQKLKQKLGWMGVMLNLLLPKRGLNNKLKSPDLRKGE